MLGPDRKLLASLLWRCDGIHDTHPTAVAHCFSLFLSSLPHLSSMTSLHQCPLALSSYICEFCGGNKSLRESKNVFIYVENLKIYHIKSVAMKKGNMKF